MNYYWVNLSDLCRMLENYGCKWQSSWAYISGRWRTSEWRSPRWTTFHRRCCGWSRHSSRSDSRAGWCTSSWRSNSLDRSSSTTSSSVRSNIWQSEQPAGAGWQCCRCRLDLRIRSDLRHFVDMSAWHWSRSSACLWHRCIGCWQCTHRIQLVSQKSLTWFEEAETRTADL